MLLRDAHEILRLDQEAGPDTWVANHSPIAGLQVATASGAGVCCMYGNGDNSRTNADLIAFYRKAAPDAARQILKMEQELARQQLIFKAERGIPTAIPSPGWTPNYGFGQFPRYQWRKTFPSGERVTVDYFPVERRWEWCFMDRQNLENFPWVRDRFKESAYEAMEEVDRYVDKRPWVKPAPSDPHRKDGK